MKADLNDRINERKIIGSDFEEVYPYFSKVSKSICKIITPTLKGSGFFIKYLIDNEYFYYLMSNEHVIKENIIKNKDKIYVYYDNEFENLEIILDKEKRYIRTFLDINIDATIIQILPEDKINEVYFLSPELDNLDPHSFKGKRIYIPQYPFGKKLKNARGIISDIFDNYGFIHLASSEPGSSGSPIFLNDSIKVIGIHKQGHKNKMENYGDFIFPIYNILKNEKKIYKRKLNWKKEIIILEN